MRKAFVLSGVALALLLFARGNALAKFHDKNFDGRYVCSGSSDDDGEQSVMFLKPNGSGGFTDGMKILRSVDFENSTLASGCTSKAGTSMACPCVYSFFCASSPRHWAGSIDDALGALAKAMDLANEHDNRFCEPEVHRLEGELLLRKNKSDITGAQKCLQRAIDTARTQSAKTFELRATSSLARLLARQNRCDGARSMLAEIYGWFTEGFDTADLKDAKALLDELNR